MVSQDGPFPSSPLRTVHAPFSAHGSPASPTFEALRLFAFRIPLCLWLGQPATLRLVPGIALGITAPLATPLPGDSRPVGNPVLTLLERVATCRWSFRPLESPSGDRSPQESLLLVSAKYRQVVVSPHQVGCGGHAVTPLETGLRPIQASPCVQDLRVHLRYLLSRFPALRRCSCPLWISPSGYSIVPRSVSALNLLPLWGYARSAETAHHASPLLVMLPFPKRFSSRSQTLRPERSNAPNLSPLSGNSTCRETAHTNIPS